MSDFDKNFAQRKMMQDQLAKKLGGGYILLAVGLLHFVFLSIVFFTSRFYITSIIVLTDAQTKLLSTTLLAAESAVFLLTMAFAMSNSPKTRASLNAISRKQTLDPEEEASIWNEVIALPSKLSRQVVASILLILTLPTLAIMYWLANLGGIQLLYLLIGLLGPTISGAFFTTLALDIALGPTRMALIPKTYQRQAAALIKGRIASRLFPNIIIVASTPTIMVGTLGYQKLANAMLPAWTCNPTCRHSRLNFRFS